MSILEIEKCPLPHNTLSKALQWSVEDYLNAKSLPAGVDHILNGKPAEPVDTSSSAAPMALAGSVDALLADSQMTPVIAKEQGTENNEESGQEREEESEHSHSGDYFSETIHKRDKWAKPARF
jgi:hypothetical protein